MEMDKTILAFSFLSIPLKNLIDDRPLIKFNWKNNSKIYFMENDKFD